MLSIDDIINRALSTPHVSARTSVRMGSGVKAITLSQNAAPADDSDEALVELLSQTGLKFQCRKETPTGAAKRINLEKGAREARELAYLVVLGEEAPETDDGTPKRGRRTRKTEEAALSNGETVKD